MLIAFIRTNIGSENSFYSILVEEGFCELPATEVDIETPCGIYKGVEYPKNICAVSIMRSGKDIHNLIRVGDSLLQAFMNAFPEALIGKVLIQRDEKSEDKKPIVGVLGYYLTRFIIVSFQNV